MTSEKIKMIEVFNLFLGLLFVHFVFLPSFKVQIILYPRLNCFVSREESAVRGLRKVTDGDSDASDGESLARVRDTGRKCWYKAALDQRQSPVAL